MAKHESHDCDAVRELFSYVNGAAEIIDLISWSKQGKS